MITQLEHDCMSVFEKVFPVSVREEIVSLMKEAYRTRDRWMNESDDLKLVLKTCLRICYAPQLRMQHDLTVIMVVYRLSFL